MDRATTFAVRVLARTAAVVRREWRLVATLVAIDAVPQIALDFVPGETERFAALLSPITFYLQLLATFRALDVLGVAPDGYDRRRPTDGRFLSAFLLVLLTTIAVLIGFVLLVVPGVLLLALWSMALPTLAAERCGVIEAMRRSWRLARPRLGGVALLAVVLLAALLGPITVLIAADQIIGPLPTAADAVLDLLGSIVLIIEAVMWAVAYAERRAETRS